MVPIKDISGHRFGKLVAIHPIERRSKYGKTIWECLCDCGNFCYILSNSLQSGRTQSCGCIQKKYTYILGKTYGGRGKKDLAGKQYGRLLVLRRSKYKPHTGTGINWLCRCSCGKYTSVSAHSLVRNRTKSCGCLSIERSTTHGLSHTKEYKRAQSKKRKECKRNLDSEWAFEMEISLKEFQSWCVVCGMTESEHQLEYGTSLHVDHVKPLSRGNGLKPGNAVLLCQFHNQSKHDKELNQLPIEDAFKITHAAEHFRCYWETIQEMPITYEEYI